MCKRKYAALLLTILATSVFAQTPNADEKNAYCQYVKDVGDAEKTLDSGIEGFGRMGQSDTNPTLKQAVIGVSKSLSKHLQGNSAIRAAALECELYDHSLDVERIVKYKLPFIENQVTLQRITDLANVLSILDEEIAATEKRKRAGNATVADIVALTQQRMEIYHQYTTAKSEAAISQFPEIPQINVEQALHQVDDLTLELQEELNHKQALQAWDVSLVGGMQKPISGQPFGTSTGAQPFVSLTFTYNFNAASYKRKLENSTSSLMEMRRQQNDELSHQAFVLQQSISASLAAEKSVLPQLIEETNRLSSDLGSLREADSTEALRMKSLIRVSLAIAAMEAHLARFKITLLSNDYAQSQ